MSRHARPPQYHRWLAGGVLALAPGALYLGLHLGEWASDTVRSAPAAATTGERIQRVAVTPAPIFDTPLPDEPQPWSPDDGPLLPSASEAPRTTDRPAPREVAPPAGPSDDGARPVPAAESAAAGGSPSPTPEPTDEPDPLGMPEIINRERLAHGCGPVALDADLQALADGLEAPEGTRFTHTVVLTADGLLSAEEAVEVWVADEAGVLDCTVTGIGVSSTDGSWTLVLGS